MDWEPAAACTLTPAGPSCPTDAESISIASQLRKLFPRSRYILSIASVHVGLYGEGSFAAAKPISPWTGLQLALAKSPGDYSLPRAVLPQDMQRCKCRLGCRCTFCPFIC
jgi:hypothetical protein